MASAMHANLLLLSFLLLLSISHAKVPKDQTFRAVNEGKFFEYSTEYNADYRAIDIPGSPSFMFHLMWYNTTPGAFYLGLRMGFTNSYSIFRWVWDANRGRPVGDNATLTFSSDGDLVLADADGTRVWSTGTANKGVVGMKILDTGNMVLYDRKGGFLWQSFDHPTDTLLSGQSLRAAGPRKLVSRNSAVDNSNGAYTLELEPQEISLYYTIAGSRYRYGNFYSPNSEGDVNTFTLEATPDRDGYDLAISTKLDYRILSHVTFNASLSILRLEADGSFVIYSYYGSDWKKTYSFFVDNGVYPHLPACNLPSKCGALGVCEEGMCVACPSAKGLLGWSRSCAPASVCGKKGSAYYYYKVVGVEQFIAVMNEGKGVVAKVEECRRRCDLDCGCKGFFYWEESSRCWTAPLLGTLAKVDNSSHVAYIKYSK